MIASKQPDGSISHDGYEDDQDPGLTSAAEDLIQAVHAKDAKAVSEALKAAFEMCDSAPHDEGMHAEESA